MGRAGRSPRGGLGGKGLLSLEPQAPEGENQKEIPLTNMQAIYKAKHRRSEKKGGLGGPGSEQKVE